MDKLKRLGVAMLALAVASALWLPCIHFFFRPRLADYWRADGIPPKARVLAARHIELWTNPALRDAELSRMRASNAEWDFMGRTFLVLALANMSLREPSSQSAYLETMDRIIDETLRLEKEKGVHHFLMNYSRNAAFEKSGTRSLFEDGEIALMLGARRLVAEKAEYKPLLRERVEAMQQYMRRSPVLSGESYPDECWTFCNTIALAAMRLGDALGDTDTAAFRREWIETARRKLVHPGTGLLVSSYNIKGDWCDGPEGSSIWMVAHCLQVLDRDFACDQYTRAKHELARSIAGFGYACEWPRAWRGNPDIDSGPIVPLLDASAGSSGLAILGAASFGDAVYLRALLTTLDFAGFPVEHNGARRYAASNQVGDAVLLYALVQGPLWAKAEAAK